MRWTLGSVGVVELPDGRLVRGRARRDGAGGEPAEWTLRLAGRPFDPALPGRDLRWRDFGVPGDNDDAVQALTEAWEYRRRAVETPGQRRWLRDLAEERLR